MATRNTQTVWIVVADAAAARVLSVRPHQRPSLVVALKHPEAHARNRDLVTDRPGRGARDVGGPVSFTPSTTPAEIELDRFARAIAVVIERGRSMSQFVELALVMPPPLLGLVRSHLSTGARHAIVATIDRRLVELSAEQLLERVDEARLGHGKEAP